MMKTFDKLRTYYRLFGGRGVWLGSKARLLRKPLAVRVQVSGVPHPITLRLRSTDVYVLWRVLVMSEYDCGLSETPDVIVDAGANIGLTSVFYANKYPGARIIAIEPERSNYLILKENARPYPNIMTIEAALWKEDCEIELLDPGCGYDAFQTKGREGARSQTVLGRVQGMTLERLMGLCQTTRIDLLKVDIEGSEKEVFERSSGWIDRVGRLAIETHDRLRSGCDYAVRNATTDFRFQWRRNETIFFARKEDSYDSDSRTSAGGVECRRDTRPTLPFRILGMAQACDVSDVDAPERH